MPTTAPRTPTGKPPTRSAVQPPPNVHPAMASLMRALNFTEEDLAANREGRISPRQRERWQAPRLSGLALMVVLAHGAAIVGLLGMIALLAASPALLAVTGVVLVLMALPFMLMQNDGLGRPVVQKDVNRGVVERVCGIVARREETGQTALLINGLTFPVSQTTLYLFREGGTYCLYYLPASQTLLSAEWMDA